MTDCLILLDSLADISGISDTLRMINDRGHTRHAAMHAMRDGKASKAPRISKDLQGANVWRAAAELQIVQHGWPSQSASCPPCDICEPAKMSQDEPR